MIIGTAGHIDHGKTSLVKALTGVDTDRLAQEKARGISIDLGFAYVVLAGGGSLGYIDVPGHHRFIQNMLAGAIGIDFGLLVVAADDGPMPQTLEHLQILDLLGVSLGCVALTKVDRITPARRAEVSATVAALLEPTTLRAAPVFAVSTATGHGIGVLRSHIEDVARNLPPRSVVGGFRLAVDRSFSLPGSGTVVTGTIFSGRVVEGDRLLVSPSGSRVRVRSIHVHNQPAESGHVGQRCALNLADVDRTEVVRGDWIVTEDLHRPTRRLDVRLRLVPGERRLPASGAAIHAYLGASHAHGRIVLLDRSRLEPGGSALAQLVLDQDVVAVRGDAVIVRDASARRTVAGGRVLDTCPPARRRQTEERLAVLDALGHDHPEARLAGVLAASPQGVDLGEYAVTCNHAPTEMEQLCARIPLRRIAGATPFAFTAAHWAGLVGTVADGLRQEHETAPDSPGLNAEQLRLRVAPQMPRAVFQQVLEEAAADGALEREGSWWFLPGHVVSLSDADEALWSLCLSHLEVSPFNPPRVRDLARSLDANEASVRLVLHKAARAGRVYRIAQDHYFTRAAVVELGALVESMAAVAPDGAVRAAEFRDRIGTGRKVAVQILEYFDRAGLTRRIRDDHRPRDSEIRF